MAPSRPSCADKNARPGVEEVPWGGREMTVKDPSGNRLVFVNREPEIPD